MPWQVTRDGDRIRLAGTLLAPDARAIWNALREAARADATGAIDFDFSDVAAIDGTILSLVVEVRSGLAARGKASQLVGAPEALAPLVALYGARSPVVPSTPARLGPIERLGAATERMGGLVREPVQFVGELVSTLLRRSAPKRAAGWRAVPTLVERTGADAIPIVLLLDFLVGFVIAYQTMRELQSYGASIYVADIVGISVTRELVPLMTAIILSGRSGAAFAAELGTMKVGEEIDALRTLGISPLRFLVMPRVVALVIAAPMLTLIGDLGAIVGGLVVAVSNLGMTSHSYLGELEIAVVSADVWTGLVKSVVFGLAIAVIGCQQGLATTGSAEGVGRRTTATVVICLFVIVVLDTVLTMAFRVFNA